MNNEFFKKIDLKELAKITPLPPHTWKGEAVTKKTKEGDICWHSGESPKYVDREDENIIGSDYRQHHFKLYFDGQKFYWSIFFRPRGGLGR